MDTMSSSSKRHDKQLFPSWFIWPLFVVTSALRVYYVMQPENWWIVHPDEIYQTMEVAHSEVYGYGFRTFEFNPPLEVTPLTPDFRRQDMRHGMAALRSYLLPHFYVTVTWCLHGLGLDFAPFLTWKVAHTLLASTLILAVYRYVIVVFRSRDIACLAAILCATCVQLHVLGTHTLANSLLAPPVFLCLAHLHMLINPQSNQTCDFNTEELHQEIKNVEDVKDGRVVEDGVVSSKNHKSKKRRKSKHYENGVSGSKILTTNGCTANDNHLKRQLIFLTGDQSWKDNHDNGIGNLYNSVLDDLQNNNVTFNESHGCVLKTGFHKGDGFPNQNGTSKQIVLEKHDTGWKRNGITTQRGVLKQNGTASQNGYLLQKDIKNGFHLQNGHKHGMNSQVEDLKLHEIHQQNTKLDLTYVLSFYRSVCSRKSITTHFQNTVTGFVLGVCVYIRIDIAALVLISLLSHWNLYKARYRDVITSTCGGFGGILVGVYHDFRCYGWGVITPYNWYKFNVLKDYSSLLFGSESFQKYIVDIFFQNLGITVLSVMSCGCCVLHLSTSCHYLRQSRKELDRPAVLSNISLLNCSAMSRTFVSTILLLMLYSSKGHKELRFVHNVIVLMLVTCAAILQSNLKLLSRDVQRYVTVIGVVLFAFSQWQDVMSLTDGSNKTGNKLAFKMSADTQDVNQCLHYLSSRTNLRGVFIERNLYSTAGYSLLYKNVPVFAHIGTNFHEFRLEDRLTELPKTRMGQTQTVSVSYVGQFSNYVSSQNNVYVLKFVLENPRYNYWVTHSDTNFTALLGRPVFTCDRFHVYHRCKTLSQTQHKRIQATINMKPRVNTSVLLHEADVLLFHGAWKRSAHRYQLVLNRDPSCVEAYLPLAAAYHRLGDRGRSQEVITDCYKKFGRAKCNAQRQITPKINNDLD